MTTDMDLTPEVEQELNLNASPEKLNELRQRCTRGMKETHSKLAELRTVDPSTGLSDQVKHLEEIEGRYAIADKLLSKSQSDDGLDSLRIETAMSLVEELESGNPAIKLDQFFNDIRKRTTSSISIIRGTAEEVKKRLPLHRHEEAKSIVDEAVGLFDPSNIEISAGELFDLVKRPSLQKLQNGVNEIENTIEYIEGVLKRDMTKSRDNVGERVQLHERLYKAKNARLEQAGNLEIAKYYIRLKVASHALSSIERLEALPRSIQSHKLEVPRALLPADVVAKLRPGYRLLIHSDFQLVVDSDNYTGFNHYSIFDDGNDLAFERTIRTDDDPGPQRGETLVENLPLSAPLPPEVREKLRPGYRVTVESEYTSTDEPGEYTGINKYRVHDVEDRLIFEHSIVTEDKLLPPKEDAQTNVSAARHTNVLMARAKAERIAKEVAEIIFKRRFPKPAPPKKRRVPERIKPQPEPEPKPTPDITPKLDLEKAERDLDNKLRGLKSEDNPGGYGQLFYKLDNYQPTQPALQRAKELIRDNFEYQIGKHKSEMRRVIDIIEKDWDTFKRKVQESLPEKEADELLALRSDPAELYKYLWWKIVVEKVRIIPNSPKDAWEPQPEVIKYLWLDEETLFKALKNTQPTTVDQLEQVIEDVAQYLEDAYEGTVEKIKEIFEL